MPVPLTASVSVIVSASPPRSVPVALTVVNASCCASVIDTSTLFIVSVSAVVARPALIPDKSVAVVVTTSVSSASSRLSVVPVRSVIKPVRMMSARSVAPPVTS